MEEIHKARQLVLRAMPAQRREEIECDPAASWGLDNLLMALGLVTRFSQDALQQPVTERMEANVLTLTCFRNSTLENVHAGEPAVSLGDPGALATLTRDISARLAGFLAVHGQSELAGVEFLSMLWRQFVAGSHRLWCSKWVTEPASLIDDLLTIDVQGGHRSELSELMIDPGEIQSLLEVAAGKPARMKASWGTPPLSQTNWRSPPY